MSTMPLRLDELLLERVQSRTGRRILDLKVEVGADEVVLSGTTRSFHIKQLAIQGVREVLPQVCLRNSITVVA